MLQVTAITEPWILNISSLGICEGQSVDICRQNFFELLKKLHLSVWLSQVDIVYCCVAIYCIASTHVPLRDWNLCFSICLCYLICVICTENHNSGLGGVFSIRPRSFILHLLLSYLSILRPPPPLMAPSLPLSACDFSNEAWEGKYPRWEMCGNAKSLKSQLPSGSMLQGGDRGIVESNCKLSDIWKPNSCV